MANLPPSAPMAKRVNAQIGVQVLSGKFAGRGPVAEMLRRRNVAKWTEEAGVVCRSADKSCSEIPLA